MGEPARALHDGAPTPRGRLLHIPRFRFARTQAALWQSRARFVVVPAGRRSGKSVIARRKLVQRAALHKHRRGEDPGRYLIGAPTLKQAKDIHWAPLKAMIPPQLRRAVRESELYVELPNGARVGVVGMDVPERVEGPPLDGFVADEYANMKRHVWTHHLRAALSTQGRPGWAWFIGVPEGRNHYYDLWRDYAINPEHDTWEGYHWKSAEILPAAEIEAARRDLDELSFQQEFEASFITWTGRAYYKFRIDVHAVEQLPYYPDKPIYLCFDFNVEPGVCSILQEQFYQGANPAVANEITACIGEVYIPHNSNTPAVCRKIIEDWGKHKGEVYCDGDSTGGARSTQGIAGTDWDLIREMLEPVFGDRLVISVVSNPSERARVNALNSRLENAAGEIRLLIDPVKCPMVVKDFDGVMVLAGGSGEIDKQRHKKDGLTHLTDGIGYHIHRKYPTAGAGAPTFDVQEIV